MSANVPTQQVVYVTAENKAIMICPQCDKLKQISVEKFKGKKHKINVHCSCGIEFLTTLDFRKGIRKDVNLNGTYRKLSQPPPLMEKCIVVNLSSKGVRLKLNDTKNLSVGDELMVHFVLKDKYQTEVKRKVKINNLGKKNSVGAKYKDHKSDNYDIPLAFYLIQLTNKA